jgi:hypothetical protein
MLSDKKDENLQRVVELGSRANSARVPTNGYVTWARLLRRYKDVEAVAGFFDRYKDLSLRTPR